MSAASVLFFSSIALPAVVRCSALTGSLLRIITLGNIKPIWFAVPRHVADAGDRRLRVIKSAGFWAKDLNYLGERFNPLLVCVIWGDSTDCLATAIAPALWIVSSHFKEDATMVNIDTGFETVWGWKPCEISETRKLDF